MQVTVNKKQKMVLVLLSLCCLPSLAGAEGCSDKELQQDCAASSPFLGLPSVLGNSNQSRAACPTGSYSKIGGICVAAIERGDNHQFSCVVGTMLVRGRQERRFSIKEGKWRYRCVAPGKLAPDESPQTPFNSFIP